jgi:hypothetical protein
MSLILESFGRNSSGITSSRASTTKTKQGVIDLTLLGIGSSNGDMHTR